MGRLLSNWFGFFGGGEAGLVFTTATVYTRTPVVSYLTQTCIPAIGSPDELSSLEVIFLLQTSSARRFPLAHPCCEPLSNWKERSKDQVLNSDLSSHPILASKLTMNTVYDYAACSYRQNIWKYVSWLRRKWHGLEYLKHMLFRNEITSASSQSWEVTHRICWIRNQTTAPTPTMLQVYVGSKWDPSSQKIGWNTNRSKADTTRWKNWLWTNTTETDKVGLQPWTVVFGTQSARRPH